MSSRPCKCRSPAFCRLCKPEDPFWTSGPAIARGAPGHGLVYKSFDELPARPRCRCNAAEGKYCRICKPTAPIYRTSWPLQPVDLRDLLGRLLFCQERLDRTKLRDVLRGQFGEALEKAIHWARVVKEEMDKQLDDESGRK